MIAWQCTPSVGIWMVGFLIDPSGTVHWVDLTEDYKVRARPEAVLAAFDRLNAGTR